ncbi:concanavalin A-like lectin/glucanase domain-containing protein [Epithele typhae]|uniref:concanavalin A-like lectin/glucanase domain-containing protein n=1 Tax=Epithele typhae TaxID=378194 RepID=UPI0020072A20|nr:concanavalin A-like lectin/glucanase domain-containing protein [Epithele typhae]KAH9931633.1 concanavalin A-like lectin/glucanase domain-containing protein [Epithele typhae]
MLTAAPLAAAILASATGATATYSLMKEFSGDTFFDDWGFYGNYDNLTNGDVTFVTKANATSEKLAYVNDAGKAIITVDNTTSVVYNYKRDSVRIATVDYYPVGSVIVFDVTHLPYGCSVWPAFWTKGINWPAGGEIDIVEGVNLMTANQMALHSDSGCSSSSSATMSGTVGSVTDCSNASGCIIEESQSSSYGEAFANAGGGVWATEYSTDGIKIWFWSRDNVPTTISAAGSSIDTSSWGTPSANWPASSCNVSEYFSGQQLILDITLCGDWAGSASVYKATCGGDGSATACYINNVINTPTNYTNAYFEINYIKIFSSSEVVLTPTVSGSSTILVTESATATSSSSSALSNDDSAAPSYARAYAAFIEATILSGASWLLL